MWLEVSLNKILDYVKNGLWAVAIMDFCIPLPVTERSVLSIGEKAVYNTAH